MDKIRQFQYCHSHIIHHRNEDSTRVDQEMIKTMAHTKMRPDLSISNSSCIHKLTQSALLYIYIDKQGNGISLDKDTDKDRDKDKDKSAEKTLYVLYF